MRRLAWMFLILATLWCAWWTIASIGMQLAVTNWLEERRAFGWQANVDKISKHGFPLSLNTRLHALKIADPISKVSLRTSQLDLVAAAYWPGYMAAKIPETPIIVSTPTGQFTIQSKTGRADLRLHPTTSLELQGMGISSGAWQIITEQKTFIAADNLKVAIDQDSGNTKSYNLAIEAINLFPGSNLRTLLTLPKNWSASFEAFAVDLNITFDRPLDRTASRENRPQPRKLDLHRIDIAWGDLSILASGQLNIDATGVPTGSIKVDATNWRLLVDLATNSGALPTQQRPQVEIMMGALSNLGGNPSDLNLTVSFKDGQMALGPINLGPAPRFILR